MTEEKQQEIIDCLGDNGNYDVFPIAQIDVDGDLPVADEKCADRETLAKSLLGVIPADISVEEARNESNKQK